MGNLERRFKSIGYNFLALKYLFNQEKSSKSDISLYKKMRCLLRGFSSSKYELYNLQDNSYKEYLSDFNRLRTAKINGAYSLIINDKYLFSKIFNKSNMTAKIYGKIKNGQIWLNNNEASFDVFYDFLVLQKIIIIKKLSGGGGKGIYRVTYKNKNIYLNDKLINKIQMSNFLENLSHHLIMEHLTQASYANSIYPGTINSIRIITMRNPHTNEVFIPIAVHKFGSEQTKPADNVWKGGMTALIDLESGVLAKSAYHLENNNQILWQPKHPDTNERIEGVVIPNWSKVKQEVIKVAQMEDNLKYVGWDVVVTDNGVKIIEGNNYSDVNILQIHQPLLIDKRVREFYKHYGIIR